MQKISESDHILIEVITIMASELTPEQMITFKRETAKAFNGDNKALNAVDAIITVAESLRKRRERERKMKTPAPV